MHVRGSVAKCLNSWWISVNGSVAGCVTTTADRRHFKRREPYVTERQKWC